ncbi:MAG TPA: tetratricopeptide repeat protein [Gemmatimonadales bacterium]
MSDLAKLKKKAAELEQRRQFDKALAVYEEMLLAQEGSDDPDVSLLNRVGDLRLRLGRPAEALDAYERAVELYVERGFLNNAIALCNKVLRQDPTRSEVHYRLGRISAEKGFRSDARRHFLDYASVMQVSGRLDEAFAALREFAELSHDNADVRIVLAEQLARHGRTEEAVEQLTILLDRYEAERRHAEAHEIAERIQALDPSFAAHEHHETGADADYLHPASMPSRPHTPPRGASGGMPDLVLIDPSDVSATASGDDAEPTHPEPEPIELFPAEEPEEIGVGTPDDLIRDAALEMVEGLTPTVEEEAGLAAGGVPALDGFEATDFGGMEDETSATGSFDAEALEIEWQGSHSVRELSIDTDASHADAVDTPALDHAVVFDDHAAGDDVVLEVAPVEFEPMELAVPGGDEHPLPLVELESYGIGDLAGLPTVPGLASGDAEDGTVEETEDLGGMPSFILPGEPEAELSAADAIEAGALEPTVDDAPSATPPADRAPGERPLSRVTSPLSPDAPEDDGSFINLGDLLRADDGPRSTRMVTEERAPSGDEQADFVEMLRKFKQGVAENVDDEDYDSHHDLGVAYKEMGLLDEAIAAFQRALRGTPHRARTYEALGHCFLEREQYAVASSVLQRALAEPGADDERLVGVLYLLGRAAEAMNQRNEALSYYQRVFAVDIEFADVASRMDLAVQVPR